MKENISNSNKFTCISKDRIDRLEKLYDITIGKFNELSNILYELKGIMKNMEKIGESHLSLEVRIQSQTQKAIDLEQRISDIECKNETLLEKIDKLKNTLNLYIGIAIGVTFFIQIIITIYFQKFL